MSVQKDLPSVPERTEYFEQMTNPTTTVDSNTNNNTSRPASTPPPRTSTTTSVTSPMLVATSNRRPKSASIISNNNKNKSPSPASSVDEEDSDALSVVIDRENEISLLRLKCDHYRHKLATLNRHLDAVKAQHNVISEAYTDKIKSGLALAALYTSAKVHQTRVSEVSPFVF